MEPWLALTLVLWNAPNAAGNPVDFTGSYSFITTLLNLPSVFSTFLKPALTMKFLYYQ
jgi:hypothetical protein